MIKKPMSIHLKLFIVKKETSTNVVQVVTQQCEDMELTYDIDVFVEDHAASQGAGCLHGRQLQPLVLTRLVSVTSN